MMYKCETKFSCMPSNQSHPVTAGLLLLPSERLRCEHSDQITIDYTMEYQCTRLGLSVFFLARIHFKFQSKVIFFTLCLNQENKIPRATTYGATFVAPVSVTFKLAVYNHNFGDKKMPKIKYYKKKLTKKLGTRSPQTIVLYYFVLKDKIKFQSF